jgi:hypothetical protein
MSQQPAKKEPRIPKMQPVKSTSIQAIGHEDDVLTVEFGNGGMFQYKGVSADQFQALKGAESVGKHFQLHIRGMFDSEKVK